jgi:flagellar basal-body rod modification protein FlgD
MQLLGTSALTDRGLAQAQAPTSAQAASGSTGSGSSSSTNAPGSLTSESTFLQLLIAQIQNQDPLNPTDAIQFVGQLVSYSQLEQLMDINQGISALTGETTSTTPANQTSQAQAQANALAQAQANGAISNLLSGSTTSSNGTPSL